MTSHGIRLWKAHRHKSICDHRARIIQIFPNGSWNASHRLGYDRAVQYCHVLKGEAKQLYILKHAATLTRAMGHLLDHNLAAETVLDNRTVSLLIGDIYLDAIAPFYDFKTGVR